MTTQVGRNAALAHGRAPFSTLDEFEDPPALTTPRFAGVVGRSALAAIRLAPRQLGEALVATYGDYLRGAELPRIPAELAVSCAGVRGPAWPAPEEPLAAARQHLAATKRYLLAPTILSPALDCHALPFIPDEEGIRAGAAARLPPAPAVIHTPTGHCAGPASVLLPMSTKVPWVVEERRQLGVRFNQWPTMFLCSVRSMRRRG